MLYSALPKGARATYPIDEVFWKDEKMKSFLKHGQVFGFLSGLISLHDSLNTLNLNTFKIL